MIIGMSGHVGPECAQAAYRSAEPPVARNQSVPQTPSAWFIVVVKKVIEVARIKRLSAHRTQFEALGPFVEVDSGPVSQTHSNESSLTRPRW